MVQKIITITNKNITIIYIDVMEFVKITETSTLREKMFAGYSSISYLFAELEQNFTETIDFDTAVKHFTPNINPIKIS